MPRESLSQRARRIASSIYAKMDRRKERNAYVIGYVRGYQDAKRELLGALMERDDGKDNHI